MKRVERTRLERLRNRVLIVGVSFALGALADTALTWRLQHYGGGLFPMHDSRVVGTTGETTIEGAPAPQETGATTAGASRIQSPQASGSGAATAVSGDIGAIVEQLRSRRLDIPVLGVARQDIHDTFDDARGANGARVHDALDIMAPRNTPVRAVEDGIVAKLFNSEAGGTTPYQYDPTGTICYYYAHLERYADGIREGQALRRGDVLGYVGSTGNASADAPHLHFAIFRLTAERQWWKGEPINPYAVLK